MREQRVILKHHADSPLVGRDMVDRPAVQYDFAIRRRLETGQHHQAGRLARTGRPEHRQKFAACDIEIEILNDQRFAVIAFLDVDEPYDRLVFL